MRSKVRTTKNNIRTKFKSDSKIRLKNSVRIPIRETLGNKSALL